MSCRKAFIAVCTITTISQLIQLSAINAIVIRDDVPDPQYLIAESEFPALVDLPEEGHGVLIAKQWVVTAAHTTQWKPIKVVTINTQPIVVAQVYVHPGYRKPPKELLSGDAAPLMDFLRSADDIALIKLAWLIEGVDPVALYRKSDEAGRLVKIYGKGATGNGLTGQVAHAPHRGKLRRAYNYITSASEQWLAYRFDSGVAAHPVEGMLGDGDSGGPVLIEDDGSWKLAGLASWKFAEGNLSKFHPGVYGQTSYHVRISYYANWIDSVTGTKKVD